MAKLAVVIPFFQRKVGILRRTLDSVAAQELPPDLFVDVIIVDDASPIPAKGEVEGLAAPAAMSFRIVEQPNGGVAAARNKGLASVSDDTDYIAFLDSDDVWNESHLMYGVAAMQAGHDFYFTDNARAGNHDSDFFTHPTMSAYIAKTPAVNGVVSVNPDTLVGLILREFPTQASTVIYSRRMAEGHKFDNHLRSAGEDLVFFTQLAARAKNPCFRPEVMVNCCDGVNIYFGSFDWDHPKRLAIAYDQVQAFTKILQTVPLTPVDRMWMQETLSGLKVDLVFYAVRYILKNRRWPDELNKLSQHVRFYPLWLLFTVFRVIFGRLTGSYKPVL